MNALPRTLAGDSQASHERLAGLLERTDLGSLSADERAVLIRSLEFPEFRAHLVRLNGILRGIPIKSRGNDDRDDLIVTGPEGERLDYCVPADGWRFLEEFFSRMRQDLDGSNLERWWTKLRYALFFAHAFSDGNKRTARYVQRLLVTGQVDGADAASTGTRTLAFSDINKLATDMVVRDELPAQYRFALGNSLRSLLELGHFVSADYHDSGYAVALEAVALMLALPEIPPMELLEHKREILRRPGYDDRRGDYDRHYRRLQERLFWEVQAILDREMPDASDVDEAIHARVLGLLAPAKRS